MRAVACGLGVVFGVTLCWTGMSDPDVIRGALTFSSAYLFLFFASAVAVAAVGLQLLRRVRGVDWVRERPQPRHVKGALTFGLGWGVTGACPGPIATQVGQGILWALPLLAGVGLGVQLFLRQGSAETEPARDLTGAARPPRRRPEPTATGAGPR
jgi:hypothetical protein